MSLINDALKQARKAPPRNVPTAVPPLRPPADDAGLAPSWLWPSVVILLIVGVIFYIGYAVAHKDVHHAIASAPAQDTQTDVFIAMPAPAPVETNTNPLVAQPEAPKFKLQAIFYSPTDPSAIVEGVTVRPGDQFREYRVKAISKYAVTFVGADKHEFQISMGN